MQKCIRCIVRLSLDSLEWEDGSGLSIRLEGPPLFLRACVLGQLQHTHLHRADFPIRVSQSLTFDRILTNCRSPSLFNEVIRGEHVKVELIQVSQDCKGGKILARFDSPAHSFLFPPHRPSASSDGLQQLQLNKSRKYQCPPKLRYRTSTTLLEVAVHSPVDSIFLQPHAPSTADTHTPSVEREEDMSTPSPSTSELDELTLADLDGVVSHTKASSRTSDAHVPRSYSEPKHIGSRYDSTAKEKRLDVLLKSYSEPLNTSQPPQSSAISKPLRVKFKPPVPRFSKSLPVNGHTKQSSHSPILYKSATAGMGFHSWQECRHQSHVDHRNHSGPNALHFRHSRGVSNSDTQLGLGQKSHAGAFAAQTKHERRPPSRQYNGSTQEWATDNSSYVSPRHDDGGIDRDGLVAKYLVKESGNARDVSPTRTIEEKLQRLQEYCCECKRSSESLGEDDLSEDLERLKASLEGERNETLNRSARMLPQESVLVQLGPQDYWSKRMSEYTGKRHRVLFDETLEKIYNRLYTEAANSQ